MKRHIDILFTLIAAIVLIIPCLLIALAVRLTSKGPALYWSDRIGLNNKLFSMPKFRSMRIDTPTTATHLLGDPDSYLTPIGGFLRKSSLDEFPQLWCVLRGEMSLVGPRPALHNQYDLKKLRTDCNVHTLRPGITGLAQVSGRDELSMQDKVTQDHRYLKTQSLATDFKIMWLTVARVVRRDGVTH